MQPNRDLKNNKSIKLSYKYVHKFSNAKQKNVNLLNYQNLVWI